MITFDNLITITIISYGTVVVVEAISALIKSVIKADFMGHFCNVFDVPFSLKTALVIRAFQLITGGWALISNYKDLVILVCSR